MIKKEIMDKQELLDLFELIHGSIRCRCEGWIYTCDLKKKILSLRLYIWQQEQLDNKNSNNSN